MVWRSASISELRRASLPPLTHLGGLQEATDDRQLLLINPLRTTSLTLRSNKSTGGNAYPTGSTTLLDLLREFWIVARLGYRTCRSQTAQSNHTITISKVQSRLPSGPTVPPDSRGGPEEQTRPQGEPTLQRKVQQRKERGRDGSRVLVTRAAWDLGHRPFGSQGKQECLCYWKATAVLSGAYGQTKSNRAA